MMPTTGSLVSPNSVELASAIPAVFRAASMQAICMPRQMPKNGTLRSRAKRDAGDLALRPALAEPAGHEDAVHRLEPRGDFGGIAFEQLGVDPADVDLDPVGHAAMDQRLVERLVGVLQADVFADHADRDLALGVLVAIDMSFQRARSGSRRGQAEMTQDLGVEPLGVILRAAPHRCDEASSAGITASLRTLQNSAILARSPSGSGFSQRHSSRSGWTPSAVSSRTECWVGLVFSSPAAAI